MFQGNPVSLKTLFQHPFDIHNVELTSERCLMFEKNQVNIRCCLNIYLASIRFKRYWISLKITSFVYISSNKNTQCCFNIHFMSRTFKWHWIDRLCQLKNELSNFYQNKYLNISLLDLIMLILEYKINASTLDIDF